MVVREGFPTRAGFLMATLGAVAGLGALWRYPHLTGLDGAAFLILYAAWWLAAGLPVLLGEMALGHGRPRNVVDSWQNSAPRGWSWWGRVQVVGALLLLALVSIVAGWAARYALDAFEAPRGDLARFQEVQEGPDALLATLGVLAAVALVSWRGFRRGLTPVALVGVPVALLLAVGLAAYANLSDGDETALATYAEPHFGALEPRHYVLAAQTALLATGVGAGVVATLAAAHRDPLPLPRKALHVALGAILLVAALWLFLIPLLFSEARADAAHGADDAGYGGLFATAGGLFSSIGGTLGGTLAGSFYALLLLLALAAGAALLEVPVAYLLDRYGRWPRWRASAVSALVAFAATLPFVAAADRLADLEAFLSGVLAPLAALLVCIRVAWVQRPLLDGLRAGRWPLAPLLRSWLGVALAAAFAALAVLGAMGFLAGAGVLDRGDGGLWDLVP